MRNEILEVNETEIQEIVSFLNNTLKETAMYFAPKLKCKNEEDVINTYSFSNKEKYIVVFNGKQRVPVPVDNLSLYKKYRNFKGTPLEIKQAFLEYIYNKTLEA